jgi:hypothetical protein
MEPGDYMVIIEDDNGVEIARVLQSCDSQLPRIGEGIVLEPDDVKDRPRLAGAYRIRELNQQPRPGERGKNRRNFKIPFLYVRADRGAVNAAAASPTRSALSSLDGDLDRMLAAEIAHSDRQLATDLDDIADEVALLINDGAPLDRSIVDRLNDARCVLKQNSIRALVHAKTNKP